MSQLLLLLSIIVGTFGALTLLDRLATNISISQSLRGRISLAVFFIFTGIGHFIMPNEMAQMLPPSIPRRVDIISLTGILEILGAIGILIPKMISLASIALILFLIGVLPANIYAAIMSVKFGGHQFGPIYLLVRIPFQVFLIWWAYYFGIRTRSIKNRGG